MKITPKAIPSDHTPAIAESSLTFCVLLAHSTPKAERMEKQHRHQDRICSQIKTQAQTSERSMRDPSADKYQPAGYDVSPDNPTSDGG